MPPLRERFPLPVLQDAPPRARAEVPASWRSLAEKRHGGPAPEALEREFPPGAALPPAEGPSRRSFLQMVTASLAAAGLTGCFRQPEEQILPYSRRPADVKPGVPLHFATGLELAGVTTGLVVRSHEGRPTKVEGNPAHPWSHGAAGVFEQAALLNLYDAERARAIRQRAAGKDFRALLDALSQRARREDGGAGLRFLVEPTGSPFLQDVYARILQRYPRARIVPFAPASATGASEGARLAYGRPLTAVPDLSEARVVLSLDEDFLSTLPGNLRLMRDFVEARQPPRVSRLWVAESHFTLTGAFADERLRVKPSQMRALALALAVEVGRAVGRPGLAGLPVPGDVLDEAQRGWVAAVAKELGASRGGGARVVAGRRQPALVHALAHALNDALGSPPRLIEPVVQPEGGPEALGRLVGELRAGTVDTLVVTAWNPVYAAPVDSGFTEALSRVPFTAYHGLHEDETAEHVEWFIPATHAFESWRDGRAPDGTASLLQPLLAPLFAGTVHEVDVLAPFFGGVGESPHAHLKRFWSARAGSPPDFQRVWEGWLMDGVIAGTEAPPVRAPLQEAAIVAAAREPMPGAVGLELQLVPDLKVHDGRFATNPWLQELPEPMTQLTWDNAALVSPATAKALGLEDEQVVTLDYRGQRLEVPVLLAPGHAEDTVTLPLGYGRWLKHPVAGGVGVSAYRLRHLDAPWGGPGLSVEPTEEHHALALAQQHWSMEKRELALQFQTHDFSGEALKHLQEEQEHLFPPVKEMAEARHKWGMAIDLHRCTGCGACVVACQAENNIPTVGKEGVRRSREMHWLRVDRYFIGEEENPRAIHQPVMCVHCEYAPCEYVCPVNATVHSDEGLNEMVYNRCIGTRYCSNNCPYKVRRFNYLDYTSKAKSPLLARMQRNPEVTVRARGVMEKCTYCVQRIEQARIASRIERRELKDGDVRTACQQTCPTGAIVFGDLADKDAAVTRLHEDPRHYGLLHELGTRPRTVHLARLKTPLPPGEGRGEGAEPQGLSPSQPLENPPSGGGRE